MFEDLRRSVQAVVPRVFETMFFTVLDQGKDTLDEAEAPDGESPLLRGEIGFEGKYSGTLLLYLPVALAQSMVSNFLGAEEEAVSEWQMVDMVKEVCNMICGNMSSDLERRTIWNLSIPSVRQVPWQQMDETASSPGIDVDFTTDWHRIKVRVELRGGHEPA